jgi:hypothetical protein
MMEAKADDANKILIVEMRGMVSEAEIDATFDELQGNAVASTCCSTGNTWKGGKRPPRRSAR